MLRIYERHASAEPSPSLRPSDICSSRGMMVSKAANKLAYTLHSSHVSLSDLIVCHESPLSFINHLHRLMYQLYTHDPHSMSIHIIMSPPSLRPSCVFLTTYL